VFFNDDLVQIIDLTISYSLQARHRSGPWIMQALRYIGAR